MLKKIFSSSFQEISLCLENQAMWLYFDQLDVFNFQGIALGRRGAPLYLFFSAFCGTKMMATAWGAIWNHKVEVPFKDGRQEMSRTLAPRSICQPWTVHLLISFTWQRNNPSPNTILFKPLLFSVYCHLTQNLILTEHLGMWASECSHVDRKGDGLWS